MRTNNGKDLDMLNRRTFIATTAATVFAAPAFGASTADASAFVTRVVNEIMGIVNSGKSTNAAVQDFNRVMGKYADMPTIARSALGPAARSASKSDISAFTTAFQGYVARKYGKQFADFKGGSIDVAGAKDRGKFIEVSATARTSRTINITFRVWDRPGRLKIIDILTEGVSLVTSERAEVGALLEQRGGDVGRLARDLNGLG
ncbi:MAG: ABC transporter substrate-binding protein [Pseudomonadota bacterium]